MKAPAHTDYPRTLKVGAREVSYRIKFVRGKGWLGLCDPKKKVIYLDDNQPRTHLFMTFIHEVLHAIEFENRIKVKHRVIYAFEEGLYSFFMANLSHWGFKK